MACDAVGGGPHGDQFSDCEECLVPLCLVYLYEVVFLEHGVPRCSLHHFVVESLLSLLCVADNGGIPVELLLIPNC